MQEMICKQTGHFKAVWHEVAQISTSGDANGIHCILQNVGSSPQTISGTTMKVGVAGVVIFVHIHSVCHNEMTRP